MVCSRLTPSLLVPCGLVSFSTSVQKVQICLVKISWWAKMGANVNRQNAASIPVGHQIMDIAKYWWHFMWRAWTLWNAFKSLWGILHSYMEFLKCCLPFRTGPSSVRLWSALLLTALLNRLLHTWMASAVRNANVSIPLLINTFFEKIQLCMRKHFIDLFKLDKLNYFQLWYIFLFWWSFLLDSTLERHFNFSWKALSYSDKSSRDTQKIFSRRFSAICVA